VEEARGGKARRPVTASAPDATADATWRSTVARWPASIRGPSVLSGSPPRGGPPPARPAPGVPTRAARPPHAPPPRPPPGVPPSTSPGGSGPPATGRSCGAPTSRGRGGWPRLRRGVARGPWSTPPRSASTPRGPTDRAVDESWPRDGVPTSFYARHKAEAERLLERVEREAGGMRVVRMRPALIFKGEAATGIRRLFAGPLLPSPLLRPSRTPWSRTSPGCASRRSTPVTSPMPTGGRCCPTFAAPSTSPPSRCSIPRSAPGPWAPAGCAFRRGSRGPRWTPRGASTCSRRRRGGSIWPSPRRSWTARGPARSSAGSRSAPAWTPSAS
jgi:hypothetical protein